MSMPEIDYSEVMGKKVECPEQCGMCCLCQPEVLPQEVPFFRTNHPKSLIRSKSQDRHFCLTMKKGHGSCGFLNGRRCDIYPDRPTFCRQFPYHFYVSDKIHVELDLSCRGAWTGKGNDAAEEARQLAEASEKRLEKALKEATSVYRDFYSICRDAGVMSDVSMIRMALSMNLDITGASGTGNTGASGTGATSSAGGGGAHNNMPPYLAVYMWKRTA